jgi:hypothetical protein
MKLNFAQKIEQKGGLHLSVVADVVVHIGVGALGVAAADPRGCRVDHLVVWKKSQQGLVLVAERFHIHSDQSCSTNFERNREE